MVTPSESVKIQLVNKPGSAATGIGRYAFEIERGLREAGVDVTTAPLRNPIPAPIGPLARRAGYDLDAFSRSYPLRANVEPGRITHLTSQTLATLLLTQRLPRPVVVTVHDILPYLLRDDPELSTYRHRLDRLMDSLAMRGLKRADRLIAVSHYTKQTVVERLSIPEERIDVVHNGVDTERFKPTPVPEEFYRKHQINPGAKVLLHVGTDDPRKGIRLLLEAMAIVRKEVPNVALLKVGAPAFTELRERNEALCRELGIADIVRWVGEVPEDELPVYYSAADALAFPSLYEGFGLPVLEAMACGTPVAAFKSSSVPEIVGDCGVLASQTTVHGLAEAIHQAIQHSGQSRTMGLARAHAFSWRASAQNSVCTILRCNWKACPEGFLEAPE
jgi:glycosyltransferase involved in cell wall biosynthesis